MGHTRTTHQLGTSRPRRLLPWAHVHILALPYFFFFVTSRRDTIIFVRSMGTYEDGGETGIALMLEKGKIMQL
jgi:hypothetical protein